jgi:ADP-glucose pyrophosphorylase
MGIYVFNRAVLAEALENSMTDFGKEVIPASSARRSCSRTSSRATGRTSAP